jgi:hypothetical protein
VIATRKQPTGARAPHLRPGHLIEQPGGARSRRPALRHAVARAAPAYHCRAQSSY